MKVAWTMTYNRVNCSSYFFIIDYNGEHDILQNKNLTFPLTGGFIIFLLTEG